MSEANKYKVNMICFSKVELKMIHFLVEKKLVELRRMYNVAMDAEAMDSIRDEIYVSESILDIAQYTITKMNDIESERTNEI